MKLFVTTTCLLLLGTFAQELQAQSFYYVPPGYAEGNYYGLDLGVGVGFGYGIGVGVPLSPNQLSSQVTPPYLPPKNWCGNDHSPLLDAALMGNGGVVADKPVTPFVKKAPGATQHSKAKKKAAPAVKAVGKTQNAKPSKTQVKAVGS